MTNQHSNIRNIDSISLNGPSMVSRVIQGIKSRTAAPCITVDSKSITPGVYVRIWENTDSDHARIDLTVDQAKALVVALTDALAATMPKATLSRNGNLPTATYSLFDENGECLVGLGFAGLGLAYSAAVPSAEAWCDAMGYTLVVPSVD